MPRQEHKDTDISRELQMLMEDTAADRISRNIRLVFFDYLKFQKGLLPSDFDEVLCDIEMAINFFEKMSMCKTKSNAP